MSGSWPLAIQLNQWITGRIGVQLARRITIDEAYCIADAVCSRNSEHVAGAAAGLGMLHRLGPLRETTLRCALRLPFSPVASGWRPKSTRQRVPQTHIRCVLNFDALALQ